MDTKAQATDLSQISDEELLASIDAGLDGEQESGEPGKQGSGPQFDDILKGLRKSEVSRASTDTAFAEKLFQRHQEFTARTAAGENTLESGDYELWRWQRQTKPDGPGLGRVLWEGAKGVAKDTFELGVESMYLTGKFVAADLHRDNQTRREMKQESVRGAADLATVGMAKAFSVNNALVRGVDNLLHKGYTGISKLFADESSRDFLEELHERHTFRAARANFDDERTAENFHRDITAVVPALEGIVGTTEVNQAAANALANIPQMGVEGMVAKAVTRASIATAAGELKQAVSKLGELRTELAAKESIRDAITQSGEAIRDTSVRRALVDTLDDIARISDDVEARQATIGALREQAASEVAALTEAAASRVAAGNALGAAGKAAEVVGGLGEQLRALPRSIAERIAPDSEYIRDGIERGIQGAAIAGAGYAVGDTEGAAIGAFLGASGIARANPGIVRTAGKDMRRVGEIFAMGQTTLPFWRNVAKARDVSGFTRGVAAFMDNSALAAGTKLGANAAKGAVAGAGVGAAFGALMSVEDRTEGAASGAGGGAFFGATVGAFGQWRTYDNPGQIMRERAGQTRVYKDILRARPDELARFEKLPEDQQHTIAHYLAAHPDLKVNYIDDPSRPPGSYDGEALPDEITVNLASKDALAEIVGHEIAHYTENHELGDALVKRALGDPDAGIPGDYTLRDAQGNPVRTADGKGFETNPEFNALRDAYLARLDETAKNRGWSAEKLEAARARMSQPEYVAREIWAEQHLNYLTSDKYTADLKGDQIAPPDWVMNLSFLRNALGKLGVVFDREGGLVRSNILGNYQKSAAFDGLMREYYRRQSALKRGEVEFLGGETRIDEARLTKETGYVERYFDASGEIVRDADGKPLYDPKGKVVLRDRKAAEADVRAVTDAIIEHLEQAGGAANPLDPDAVQKRTTTDGRTIFAGRYFSDETIAAVEKSGRFNPVQIDNLKQINNELKTGYGREWTHFYQAATRKGGGNISRSLAGRWRTDLAYGIKVSKAENILVSSVSLEVLHQNAARAVKLGAAKLWNNDSGELLKDIRTYLDNLTSGQPGDLGLGADKKNFINNLLGIRVKSHGDVNPYHEVTSMPKTILTSLRIDRMNRVTPVSERNVPFSAESYTRAAKNLRPDAAGWDADAVAVETDFNAWAKKQDGLRAKATVAGKDQKKVVLQWVHADPQGKGIGESAMKELTRLADERGVTLELSVEGADPSRLNAWYRRHGFEGGVHMTRKPVTQSNTDAGFPGAGKPGNREDMKPFPKSQLKTAVYHGTGAKFDSFDPKRRGSVSEASDAKVGVWFTDSPERANRAARDAAGDRGVVAKAFIDTRNLLTLDELPSDPAESAKTVRNAWRQGYDAVSFPGELGGRDYVVRDENQVKVAGHVGGQLRPDAVKFGPSKDYGDFDPAFQDVEVPGVPTKSFTVKRRGKTLKIQSLYIDDTQQGRGHGRQAVRALESWAIQNGVEKLVLESVEDSVGFWEKQGFVPEGRASESDWTRMVKYLSGEQLRPDALKHLDADEKQRIVDAMHFLFRQEGREADIKKVKTVEDIARKFPDRLSEAGDAAGVILQTVADNAEKAAKGAADGDELAVVQGARRIRNPETAAETVQYDGERLDHAIRRPKLKLVHYTNASHGGVIDPNYMGKGRATPRDQFGEKASFWFVKGSVLNADRDIIARGKRTYSAEVSGARIYDGVRDPLDHWAEPNRWKADRVLIDAGYVGKMFDHVDGRKLVMMFEPVAVKDRGQFKGGDSAQYRPEAAVFVSPNVDELNFTTAKARIDEEPHARFRTRASEIAPDAEVSSAVGDWADGAEDTLALTFNRKMTLDQTRVLAAKLGLEGKQKAVLHVVADDNGPDALFQVEFPAGTTLDAARQAMADAGLEFRTLVRRESGVTGFVFDEGRKLGDQIVALAQNELRPQIESYAARGEFLGSWTDREEGLAKFRSVLAEAESRGSQAGDVAASGDSAGQLRPDAGQVAARGVSSAPLFEGTEAKPDFSKDPRVPVVGAWLASRSRQLKRIPHDSRTPAAKDAIATTLADEIAHAAKQNRNALGWYEKKIKEAMDTIAEIHPEVNEDHDRGSLYKAITAITSNGQAVESNFARAEELYQHWKDTGRLQVDAEWGGPRKDNINDGLTKLQTMIDERGLSEAMRFLNSKFSVRELKEQGFQVGGEALDHKVYGSAIFGPKVGGGFYPNLQGDFSPVTMDLWLMRTWNRINGSYGQPDPVNMGRALADIRKAAAENPGRPESGQIEKMSDRQLANWAEKTFDNWRYVRKFKNDTPFDRPAKRFALSKEGAQEAPRNTGERAWVREVFSEVDKKLAARGMPAINNADKQALLWYYEKDLYALFGAANKNAEPADYADAARKVVASKSASLAR